ncbi:MAG: F0F1 ATP synthase subunit epsilon [Oligoflexia bacterium]|nr:F0F1 ATP synthase subunit epsilon [Oligoflexia bacterium]
MVSSFAPFNLDIYTPIGVVVKQFSADSLIIPTGAGQINILPGHVHLMTILRPGIMIVRQGEKNYHYTVTTGICRILKDQVLILSKVSEKFMED